MWTEFVKSPIRHTAGVVLFTNNVYYMYGTCYKKQNNLCVKNNY